MVERIANYMLKNDRVAVWLGISIVKVSRGYALIKMKVREAKSSGELVALFTGQVFRKSQEIRELIG